MCAFLVDYIYIMYLGNIIVYKDLKCSTADYDNKNLKWIESKVRSIH